MKPWLSVSIALCLVVPTLASAEEVLLDGIAAQVGNEIVLLSEVMVAAGPTEQRARAAGASEQDILGIRSQALDVAIERALIRQVVRRAELDASEAEVDDAIRGIAEENKITDAELRTSVESQGMPYTVYRERIRGEIEHSKVMQGIVASRVRVTEDDIKDLYLQELGEQPEGGREFYLRHILVAASPERSVAETCQVAAAGRARIAGGEEFMPVAAQISQANPERGGTLGWIHERELAAWMKPIVLSLGNSGLSDVIEMPFGCNLIELVDHRDYTPISYEQAQGPLHGQLFNQQMELEYTKFIEELRADTYIERKDVFAASEAGPS
jgi:peptidyl-prolyl cis-trans isomerase SurA